MNLQRCCKIVWLNIFCFLPRICTKQINRLFVYFKWILLFPPNYWIPSLQPQCLFYCNVWPCLLFCNMDQPCGSVRLAISIKSSALAVCANIISNTLKAPIITEQEALWSPANARLWIKIFHVCIKKNFDLMTDSVANSDSEAFYKIKSHLLERPVSLFLHGQIVWGEKLSYCDVPDRSDSVERLLKKNEGIHVMFGNHFLSNFHQS